MTEAYTCPKCGRTSYHPMDVKFQWCGHCKESPLGIQDHERWVAGSLAGIAPDKAPERILQAVRDRGYARDPSPSEKQPVLWEGAIIGYVRVTGQNDYADERGEDGHFAREAFHDILRDHPHCPTDPEMKWQPWMLLVLKEICKMFTDARRDERFEDQVMQRYLRHYGLTQMTELMRR